MRQDKTTIRYKACPYSHICSPDKRIGYTSMESRDANELNGTDKTHVSVSRWIQWVYPHDVNDDKTVWMIKKTKKLVVIGGVGNQ